MGSLLTENTSPHKSGAVLTKWIYSIGMLLIGVLMVVPFVFMISASLKPTAQVFINPLNIIPDTLYWDNYKRIFTHPHYFQWYWNSIRVVVITIVCRAVLVTMAAYAFARLQFKGKNVLFMGMLATMMIPSDTTIVARFLMYQSLNLIDTQWAIIIPATFDVFFVFMLRQFFMTIPKELSESALVDGCSQYRIYYRIILPLAVPPLITMVMFTFIWIWNDFINPFIFISSIDNQLVTVGLEYFQQEAGRDYALQMAGACLIVVIPIVLFVVSQRFFIEGIANTGIKG